VLSRAEAPPRIFNYRWLLVLAVVVFLLDQVTKAWIAATIPFGTFFEPEAVSIIPGFFRLVHVGNTGAAWGIFEGKSLWLAILALVTLVAIFAFRAHLELKRMVVQVCFGLLCGGIVGNLVDRLIHKHVIDFLLFHIGDYVWPAFNLADSAICVGVLLYLWHSFKTPPEKESSFDPHQK
jgi:signal peptidase II